ncbi:hypothetical protein L1I79_24180 [Strepomyces sp. STD 3.1]|uniref:hypothetical protein n=1 Tax=Streptomyces sp. NPDC058985 TaxID=3346684 RepID=UPI001F20D7FB|nr:hypothetical protein [Streptomyces sp. STD 3.1]
MVNVGDAPALAVTVVDQPRMANGLERPFDLEPQSAHPFGMIGYAGAPIPNALRVTWDGQPDPVSLLVPPG